MRNADIAADALADIVGAAFPDLVGQERIGDRGARGADQIRLAGLDDFHHVIRAGHAIDADHWHVCHFFDRLGGPRLIARFEETRWAGIVAPLHEIGDFDIPKIAHTFTAHQLDEAQALFKLEPRGPE